MASTKQWVIGASSECDLVVDQPMVSSRHCCLTVTSDGFRLEDLTSTNGTYVNGSKITRPTIVAPSDKITLGQRTPMPWPEATVLAHPQGTDGATDTQVTSRALPGTSESAKESARSIPSAYLVGGGIFISAILVIVVLAILFTRRPTIVVTSPASADNGDTSRERVRETGSQNRITGEPNSDRMVADHPVNSSALKPPVAKTSMPPAPSIDRLAAQYESAIVWLGVEDPDGSPVPVASGWIVDGRAIATSGIAASELKEYQGIGLQVFAANEKIGSVPILQLRVHSGFDANNPSSDASRFHNVGVVIVESPLPRQCPVASSDELMELNVPGEVSLLGYRFDRAVPTAPAKTLRPPEFCQANGVLLYRESNANADSLSARLELKIDSTPGTDGGAVFDKSGKIIGVFRCVKSAPHAISISHLRDLLSSQ